MKSVSGKDFCKALERKGWVLKRTTRSSHFIYAQPDHPDLVLSVPVHGNRDLQCLLEASPSHARPGPDFSPNP